MSDHDDDVIDGESPKAKISKHVEGMIRERDLVEKQNELYFDVIGLQASKKDKELQEDQKRVSKSRENKNIIAKYEKAQSAKHDKEKQDLKYQSLYENMLEKFAAAVEKLSQAGHLADEKRTEVLQTRTMARQAVRGTTPDYQSAYETLNKQDIDKVLAGLPAMVIEANKLFASQAEKSFEKYEQLRKTLAVAPLPEGAKDEFTEQLLKATDQAKVPARDLDKLDKAVLGKLQIVETAIQKEVEEAVAAQKSYNELTKAGTGLAKLEQTAPDNLDTFTQAVIADLQRKCQNAKTAIALNDHKLAYQTLKALADECLKWQQQLDAELIGSYRDWADRAKAVKTALAEAKRLADSTSAPQELVTQAANLAESLGDLATAKPEPGRACNDVVKQFDALQIKLNGLAIRAADSAGFRLLMGELVKPNDAKIIEVSKALNNLELKLNGRQDIDQALRDKSLVPLKQSLQNILNDWIDKKKQAFDTVSLDAGSVADKLAALAGKIEDASSDDEITTLSKSPELERAQGALQMVMQEAQAVQLKIMTFNPKEGLSNRAFLKDVTQMLATSEDASLVDSVRLQLLKEIGRQKDIVVFADDRIKLLRAAIDEHLMPVPARLQQQGELIGKLRGGEARKLFETMHGTLTNEHQSVVAMSISEQISVLEQAVAEAAELADETNKFLLELKNKPVDDPREPTGVIELKKLFEFLDGMLHDSKRAQKYMIVTYSTIEERLAKAQADLGKSTFAAMTKELRAIREEIDTMRIDADTARDQYNAEAGFQAEAKAIQSLLKNDLLTTNAPEYLKKATSDLATLKKNAMFEGGYEAATDDAKKMKIALGELLASARNARGIPVLIVEKENAATAERKKEELQRAKWEAEVDIITKDLEAAKSMNAKEIEGLLSLVKDATKAVKKSNDYGLGRSQLEQVHTKLALLQENPRGLAIASRGQLVGVNVLYRKAVVEFGKALGTVEQTVGANLEDGDKGKFTREIVAVRCMLNPALFTQHIKIITTVDDEAKRSTEREKALRGVRKMMAFIKNDYHMRELADTPNTVHPTMAGVVSKIYLALLNLENNLLVSL